MKLKSLLFILTLFPTALSAHWLNVGNADYNWGPFLVYTIELETENGAYEANQLPFMLSFKYEKPIEGKNFAISLAKEMEHLNVDKAQGDLWLKQMQQLFPDFSPNDIFAFCRPAGKKLFHFKRHHFGSEFEPQFAQALISIWLSPNSNFIQLQPQLLGKEKNANSPEKFKRTPEVDPLGEDDASPQLPPNFQFQDQDPELG
ncbi:LOW QUALITY PROTEIN: dihydroorotate dehydrogenase 2 [Aggregatibacter actinomycetemcomitans ANH9381]|nr:LOW QUALITY PROTEIN: dihydroorotate dehydrogenase 2 [Aggregatibacter actinomycetemcomitans ANH9381]